MLRPCIARMYMLAVRGCRARALGRHCMQVLRLDLWVSPADVWAPGTRDGIGGARTPTERAAPSLVSDPIHRGVPPILGMKAREPIGGDVPMGRRQCFGPLGPSTVGRSRESRRRGPIVSVLIAMAPWTALLCVRRVRERQLAWLLQEQSTMARAPMTWTAATTSVRTT